MRIHVVGLGAYVCGVTSEDFGTIAPSVFTFAKRSEYAVSEVRFYAQSEQRIRKSEKKIKSLIKAMRFEKVVSVYFEKADLFPIRLRSGDCVLISTPDHTHSHYIEIAINHHCHVLVVKPLTGCGAESARLANLADKQGVVARVEFHKRFDMANRMIRHHYLNRDLGQPLYCITEYSQRISVPTITFKAWAETTNVFQYLGVHYVDVMRFVIPGATPIRVLATGQKGLLINLGIHSWDAIQAQIQWQVDEHVFSQIICCSWVDPMTSPAMSRQNFRYVGQSGSISSDQMYRGLEVFGENIDYSTPNPYFTKAIDFESDGAEWMGYGIDSITSFLKDVFYRDSMVDLQDNANYQRNDVKSASFWDGVIADSVSEAVVVSLNNNSSWVDVERYLRSPL